MPHAASHHPSKLPTLIKKGIARHLSEGGSYSSLARDAKVARSSVQAFHQGTRADVSLATAVSLASYFGFKVLT